MKKIITAALLAAGLGVSGFAAAQTAFETTTTVGVEGSGAAGGECVLLANQVVLTASSNVHAAWACDEITSAITVAACHQGGSRAPLTVNCVETPPTSGTWLPSGCTGPGTIEIANYRGYVAASTGGSVVADDLGGRCTAASILTLF